MSWITTTWSGIAGACIAVAVLMSLIWAKSRDSWPYLLFSVAAIGDAGMALLELTLMHAQSPAQFVELWRWLHASVFVLVVALVWFIRFYLQAGRPWLAWLITGMRILVLILTFSLDPNLNFTEITGLHSIPFLGETVVVPIGERNPWTTITTISGLLFLIFVLDASFSAWRAGNRRRATIIGATFATAIIVGIAFSEMHNNGSLPVPMTLSVPFLVILMGVAYELSAELVRVNQLARELQRSENRMSLATSGVDVDVWEWDIERDEVWVSDSRRKRLGLRENDKLGFSAYLDNVHPDDRDTIRKIVLDTANKLEDFELEFRLVAANNETRWMRTRGRVEYGHTGKPTHMRGVSVDITERKRAEAELQELQRELAHVQRVSAIGQLSSALAHEINQPLGAILRNAEAAELFLQVDPPDLEELRDIIKDIRSDEQRASAVIERMRSLLKRSKLQLETLTVKDLIEQVVMLLHAETQLRHTTLDVDVPPDFPRVRGDRVHLQQVIMNLVMNSMEASDEGANGAHHIVIRASQTEDGMGELAVIDNGKGVPPDKLPHLFEPFFTTKPKGTGIGLAISKTIVEAHGGRITAENNPERGATFRFTLKIAE